MNRYARNGPNWVEVPRDSMICNTDGIAVSWDTIESWTSDQCAEFGLSRIVDGPGVPSGFYETGRSLVDVDGVPTLKRLYAEYEVFQPTEPPSPVPLFEESPPHISDRQFGRGLWEEKIITFDECSAFVSSGVVPPPLQAIIDTLPDDDTGEPTPRKIAIIFIQGAKEYQFDHPLVDVVRQAQQWTVEHLRERWTYWATL
jgi:hypothetical protein